MTRACVAAHEIDVTLVGAELMVDRTAVPWRPFPLRADANLLELHIALQLACGWENMRPFPAPDADVIGGEAATGDDLRPRLMDGAGTFPPEDVGGLGDWRPDSFDLAAEQARIDR